MKRALILDRDGVVCEPLDRYLLKRSEFKLVSGIERLVATAKSRGYVVAIATNQPQIAKGLLALDELTAIHNDMQAQLGHRLDGIYHCPHQDSDACACRKPKPGMLTAIARDHDIDLLSSFMVGDAAKDILAGQAVGCSTVFVRHRYNASESTRCSPDHFVDSITDIQTLL